MWRSSAIRPRYGLANIRVPKNMRNWASNLCIYLQGFAGPLGTAHGNSDASNSFTGPVLLTRVLGAGD